MTSTRTHPETRRPSRRRAGLLAGFGVVYGVWLVWGVIDNLVWMPQLIAPSIPLDEIYAVLTRAGSAPGVAVPPVLWFLFWGAAGLVYLLVFPPAHRRFRPIADAVPPLAVVGIGVALFGAMAFFQWWSGFAIGMEVSDELPPGVGNTTPFGMFCFTGGFLIALTGGVLCLIGTVRAARPRATLSASNDRSASSREDRLAPPLARAVLVRSRLGPLFVVLVTCLVGVLVLHLAGVALAASIAIGLLAAAATLFTNWANTLHRRHRDSSRE